MALPKALFGSTSQRITDLRAIDVGDGQDQVRIFVAQLREQRPDPRIREQLGVYRLELRGEGLGVGAGSAHGAIIAWPRAGR